MESQKPKDDGKKKIWVKPQLVVYGDVEKITNTCGPTRSSITGCSG